MYNLSEKYDIDLVLPLIKYKQISRLEKFLLSPSDKELSEKVLLLIRLIYLIRNFLKSNLTPNEIPKFVLNPSSIIYNLLTDLYEISYNQNIKTKSDIFKLDLASELEQHLQKISDWWDQFD